jgi:hypothetical protein
MRSPRESFSLEKPLRTLEIALTPTAPTEAQTDPRFFALSVDGAPLPITAAPKPVLRVEKPVSEVSIVVVWDAPEPADPSPAIAPMPEPLPEPFAHAPRVPTGASLLPVDARERRGARRWKVRVLFLTLLLAAEVGYAYRASLRVPHDVDDAHAMLRSAIAHVVRESTAAPTGAAPTP